VTWAKGRGWQTNRTSSARIGSKTYTRTAPCVLPISCLLGREAEHLAEHERAALPAGEPPSSSTIPVSESESDITAVRSSSTAVRGRWEWRPRRCRSPAAIRNADLKITTEGLGCRPVPAERPGRTLPRRPRRPSREIPRKRHRERATDRLRPGGRPTPNAVGPHRRAHDLLPGTGLEGGDPLRNLIPTEDGGQVVQHDVRLGAGRLQGIPRRVPVSTRIVVRPARFPPGSSHWPLEVPGWIS